MWLIPCFQIEGNKLKVRSLRLSFIYTEKIVDQSTIIHLIVLLSSVEIKAINWLKKSQTVFWSVAIKLISVFKCPLNEFAAKSAFQYSKNDIQNFEFEYHNTYEMMNGRTYIWKKIQLPIKLLKAKWEIVLFYENCFSTNFLSLSSLSLLFQI